MMNVFRLSLCAIAGSLVSLGQAQQPAQDPSVSLLAPPLSDMRRLMLQRFELPPVYDYHRLGVFCKLDVQLEKRLRFPVRFRLGDPMKVDALEDKGPLRIVDPR